MLVRWFRMEETSCLTPNVSLTFSFMGWGSWLSPSVVLPGAVGLVHGQEWTGRKARFLRHSSGQPVPPRSASRLRAGSVLCQSVDGALFAAATTPGTRGCVSS